MVRRSGRYKSIVNGGNGKERGNSNGFVNQQNKIPNVMFLQQDSNGGYFIGFHLRISSCPVKMVQLAL